MESLHNEEEALRHEILSLKKDLLDTHGTCIDADVLLGWNHAIRELVGLDGCVTVASSASPSRGGSGEIAVPPRFFIDAQKAIERLAEMSVRLTAREQKIDSETATEANLIRDAVMEELEIEEGVQLQIKLLAQLEDVFESFKGSSGAEETSDGPGVKTPDRAAISKDALRKKIDALKTLAVELQDVCLHNEKGLVAQVDREIRVQSVAQILKDMI